MFICACFTAERPALNQMLEKGTRWNTPDFGAIKQKKKSQTRQRPSPVHAPTLFSDSVAPHQSLCDVIFSTEFLQTFSLLFRRCRLSLAHWSPHTAPRCQLPDESSLTELGHSLSRAALYHFECRAVSWKQVAYNFHSIEGHKRAKDKSSTFSPVVPLSTLLRLSSGNIIRNNVKKIVKFHFF